jgi:hypothetical protein
MTSSAAVPVASYRSGEAVQTLNLYGLDQFRWEIQQMPNWRLESSLCEDYYDGNQMSCQTLQDLEDRGIPPITRNLIGPTVDVILGMEARTRTNYLVRPVGKGGDDIAEAYGYELFEMERQSGADDACSLCYADSIKAGIGWCEVGYETDPFRYRYRVRRRDWREFKLDPFCQEFDISDARFLIRDRFYDKQLLQKLFADKAKEIDNLGTGYHAYGLDQSAMLFEPQMLAGGFMPWRDYSRTEMEWMDIDRNRLQLSEVWYRVYVRGEIMRLANGMVLEYDDKNPVHAEIANRGIADVETTVWSEARLAYWIGWLKLIDIPTPYPHRDFPYVPFWGLREGRTGSPYGYVRRMRPLQDEVNARASKMLWALSSRRVYASKKAVDDHEQTRLEAARPDAYFILNNKPGERFEVDDNQGIASQQYEAYTDAKQMIQDCGGVYQSMLGKDTTGADSGVAIANLVEQGATTLAPTNRRFKIARTKVGQLMLALRVKDIGTKEHTFEFERKDGSKKRVTVNKRKQGVGGKEVLENDIRKMQATVMVDDVPATPTFRLQQMNRLADLVAKLPPQMQLRTIRFVVEASDVPNKAEFIKELREMTGAPDLDEMTPEERQAYEQQQELQSAQQQLAMRGAAAKVAVEEAKAQTETAKAQKTQAETQSVMEGISKIMADIQKTLVEVQQIKQNMANEAALMKQGGPQKSQALLRW